MSKYFKILELQSMPERSNIAKENETLSVKQEGFYSMFVTRAFNLWSRINSSLNPNNQDVQPEVNKATFSEFSIDEGVNFDEDEIQYEDPHEVEEVDLDVYYFHRMKNAKSYEEWSVAASKLDKMEGLSEWVKEPKSNVYDWRLLQTRMEEIKKIRESPDAGRKEMRYALNLSLSRNLGDMGNDKLYRHTRIGTKQLISDYIDTVTEQLSWIGDTNESLDMSLKEKHDYFMSLRQSYGRTALLLSGGGTLGFFHVGVLRALINSRLLPRIISGTSSGSIMASLVCTLKDEDRDKLLNNPENFPLDVFESAQAPESIKSRLNRFFTEGNIYDRNVLRDVLRGQFGDITFQEAYNRSRLVLNIAVSASSAFDMPQLWNYITAPDVVVWSAVLASCSVPLFFPEAGILIKDKDGNIVPWTPTDDKYRDGSIDNDIPLRRISELFSVNHFIVVQINPHIAPFLHKGLGHPSIFRTGMNFCLQMFKEEVQHRCKQFKELNIAHNSLKRFEGILSQRYTGDITIAPELTTTDIGNILSNLSLEQAFSFIQRGEKETWCRMSKLQYSLKIELAIDAIIYKLRLKLLGESPQLPHDLSPAGALKSSINNQHSMLTPTTASSSYFPNFDSQSYTTHFGSTFSQPENENNDSNSPKSIKRKYDLYSPQPNQYSRKGSSDSVTALIPPTPFWETENFANKVPYLLRTQYYTTKGESTSPNAKEIRPSLLPHDISRRGSNASIRDVSSSPSSSARFERRKKVTSAQFFIAPEFDWQLENVKKLSKSNSVSTYPFSNEDSEIVKTSYSTSPLQDITTEKAEYATLNIRTSNGNNNKKNLSIVIPNR